MLRAMIHEVIVLFFTFMIIIVSSSAQAAGFSLIEIPADEHRPAMRGAVWYPCQLPSGQFQLGPLTLPGVRDCAAFGSNWPLVVMSHGSGGSFLGHHDTAEALANAGFVVAAINHPGDNFQDLSEQGHLRAFANRPYDITRLIDFMRDSWSERTRLAADATGLFGFSRGGYTGLAAVGAVPDYKMATNFCLYDDIPFCEEIRQQAFPALPKSDFRIKSLVLADPVNLFSAAGLENVSIPIQLWASELGGDGVLLNDVESIRDALKPEPEFQIVKNAGHFSFLAPCSYQQAQAVPEICSDPSGFDRASFHKQFNTEVIRFFKKTLDR